MNIDQRIEKKYKKTECVKMKQHCDTDTDNILMEDWCDIEPKNYVRKGLVNPQQCFALHHLITWMETGLNTTGEIKDPTTNVVMDNETVIELCGRHVYNGNDLPAVLGAYVMDLIPPEDQDEEDVEQAVEQNARLQRIGRIYEILSNYVDSEDFEEYSDFFMNITQDLADVNSQIPYDRIMNILRDYLDLSDIEEDKSTEDLEQLIHNISLELY